MRIRLNNLLLVPLPVFTTLLAALLASSETRADDLCSYYRKHLPRLYEIVCHGSQSRPRAGASYSSFADAFKLNSASIPTEPSPYGLESIASLPRASSSDDPARNYSFSIVKGFRKVGTAVSTASNMSFYGNDIIQRSTGLDADANIRNPEEPKGHFTNLNIGTSIALNSAGSSEASAPSIGVSLRYNQITNTMGWGAGVSASAGRAVFGLGVSKEKVSNLLPEVLFYSAVLGIKLPLVEFEYTFLSNEGGVKLDPIHILTATGVIGHFLLSAAARKLNYVEVGDVTQMHYAVQFQLNSHIAFGYLYNYLPGTNSLALQLFL